MTIVTIEGDNSPQGILKHWERKTKSECAREIRRCWELISTLKAQLNALAAPVEIIQIGERLLADQRENDHYTADPLFTVQRRHIVCGLDTDYTDEIAWIYDGEIVHGEEAERLEKQYQKTREIPDDYTRTGMAESWEHVDTYLTRESAEARINGGKDSRLWVDSAYRNSEMRAVRNFLMALAAQAKSGGSNT